MPDPEEEGFARELALANRAIGLRCALKLAATRMQTLAGRLRAAGWHPLQVEDAEQFVREAWEESER